MYKLRGRLLPLLLVPLALLRGCATGSDGLAQTRARPTPSAQQAPLAATPTPTPAERTERDFDKHVAALKGRLPSREFTIVVERPFVVVGDGGREAVESSARNTVKWAVDLLKRDYFTKDPEEILDVWLFKDAESYEKHRAALFGPGPDTPYGYYSARHKALVMNIATGGGTLVHEIVHPFVAANFPGCPAWLNEGLGSLYEQSGEQDGHIVGYTNWRLPGLQNAIRERRVRTFEELTGLRRERLLLERDRHELRAGALPLLLPARARPAHALLPGVSRKPRRRPDGLRHAAKKSLGVEDMEAFQKDWEKFVLGLTEEIRLTPLPR